MILGGGWVGLDICESERDSCVLGSESGWAYASLAWAVGANTRHVLRLELGDFSFSFLSARCEIMRGSVDVYAECAEP